MDIIRLRNDLKIGRHSISEQNHDRLLNACLNDPYQHSLDYALVGAIENQIALHDYDLISEIFGNYIKNYFQKIKINYDNYSIRKVWFNSMKSKEYNPLHTHDGDYSFVYIFNFDKELEKERNPKYFSPKSFYAGQLVFVFSKENKILEFSDRDLNNKFYIFPSNLNHLVYPFYSDVTRYSLSGNINLYS